MPKQRVNNTNCCVHGCHSKKGKDVSISFHNFPLKNKSFVSIENASRIKERMDKYKAWMFKLKMGKPAPKRATVCSLHFRKEDFILPDYPSQKRRLKSTAVPSLKIPASHPPSASINRRARSVRLKPSYLSKTSQVDQSSKPYTLETQVVNFDIEKRKNLPARKLLKRKASPSINVSCEKLRNNSVIKASPEIKRKKVKKESELLNRETNTDLPEKKLPKHDNTQNDVTISLSDEDGSTEDVVNRKTVSISTYNDILNKYNKLKREHCKFKENSKKKIKLLTDQLNYYNKTTTTSKYRKRSVTEDAFKKVSLGSRSDKKSPDTDIYFSDNEVFIVSDNENLELKYDALKRKGKDFTKHFTSSNRKFRDRLYKIASEHNYALPGS